MFCYSNADLINTTWNRKKKSSRNTNNGFLNVLPCKHSIFQSIYTRNMREIVIACGMKSLRNLISTSRPHISGKQEAAGPFERTESCLQHGVLFWWASCTFYLAQVSRLVTAQLTGSKWQGHDWTHSAVFLCAFEVKTYAEGRVLKWPAWSAGLLLIVTFLQMSDPRRRRRWQVPLTLLQNPGHVATQACLLGSSEAQRISMLPGEELVPSFSIVHSHTLNWDLRC